MSDTEFLSADEAATALDPAIGDGTPDTAPFLSPFGDDDFDGDDSGGEAEDDDEVEAGEDATPIEADL